MSREAVLARIRQALAVPSEAGQQPPLAATHPQTQPVQARDPEAIIALVVERLREYDARVFRATRRELTVVIADALRSAGRRRIAVPACIAPEWLPNIAEFIADRGLDNTAIDACDGVLTAATLAVAESGSIVLRHGPREGRRVLTLLPDYHLCVVEATQIVATLPECMALLEPNAAGLTTFISGPSATADIEMTRIRGVHGPRSLDVIVVSQDDV